jgi:CubicO group peptidase (beta-lactamase class C family)
MKRLSLALLLALGLAAACASNAPAVSPAVRPSQSASARGAAVFPGEDWERIADPSTVGYCADKLDAVTAKAKGMSTTAMMAIVGGRVLYEYGDVTTVSYLASVRKSVLAMLFGKYVKNGTIKLDKTLAQLGIDDHGGLTASEKEATIADLLSARSGIYHEASNSGDDLASAPPRGSQKHGTYYLYSNWDFNAVGTIFEQETKQSIYDALERDLVRPIGMRDFDRATHRRTGDATKSVHLAYHMNFSTRDMARIGYVMLREGQWKGQQIVPRDWARRISSVVTPVSQMNPERHRKGPFGYGYLWWIWDGPAASGPYEGAYTGQGAVGQFITVLPKRDMVVVHKTVPGANRNVSGGQFRELLQGILDAQGCTTSPALRTAAW